jgi:hypothetical protein
VSSARKQMKENGDVATPGKKRKEKVCWEIATIL